MEILAWLHLASYTLLAVAIFNVGHSNHTHFFTFPKFCHLLAAFIFLATVWRKRCGWSEARVRGQGISEEHTRSGHARRVTDWQGGERCDEGKVLVVRWWLFLFFLFCKGKRSVGDGEVVVVMVVVWMVVVVVVVLVLKVTVYVIYQGFWRV